MGFPVSGEEGVMAWGDPGMARKRVQGVPGVGELGNWGLERQEWGSKGPHV